LSIGEGVYLLLWLAVIALSPLAGWRLSRSTTGVSVKLRYLLIVLLLIVFAAAPVQYFTKWSLAGPFPRAIIYPVAFFAYVVTIFVVGRNGRGFSAILAAPLVYFVASLLLHSTFVLFFILMVWRQGSTFIPLLEGRISPTISYRIFLDHALIGGSAFSSYTIYRNPRWFRLIHKEVASGPTPCWSEPTWAVVRESRDEKTVLISCKLSNNWGAKETVPIEIHFR
jgi:hypothetical protein